MAALDEAVVDETKSWIKQHDDSGTIHRSHRASGLAGRRPTPHRYGWLIPGISTVDGSGLQECGQEATLCQTNNLRILEKTDWFALLDKGNQLKLESSRFRP